MSSRACGRTIVVAPWPATAICGAAPSSCWPPSPMTKARRVQARKPRSNSSGSIGMSTLWAVSSEGMPPGRSRNRSSQARIERPSSAMSSKLSAPASTAHTAIASTSMRRCSTFAGSRGSPTPSRHSSNSCSMTSSRPDGPGIVQLSHGLERPPQPWQTLMRWPWGCGAGIAGARGSAGHQARPRAPRRAACRRGGSRRSTRSRAACRGRRRRRRRGGSACVARLAAVGEVRPDLRARRTVLSRAPPFAGMDAARRSRPRPSRAHRPRPIAPGAPGADHPARRRPASPAGAASTSGPCSQRPRGEAAPSRCPTRGRTRWPPGRGGHPIGAARPSASAARGAAAAPPPPTARRSQEAWSSPQRRTPRSVLSGALSPVWAIHVSQPLGRCWRGRCPRREGGEAVGVDGRGRDHALEARPGQAAAARPAQADAARLARSRPRRPGAVWWSGRPAFGPRPRPGGDRLALGGAWQEAEPAARAPRAARARGAGSAVRWAAGADGGLARRPVGALAPGGADAPFRAARAPPLPVHREVGGVKGALRARRPARLRSRRSDELDAMTAACADDGVAADAAGIERVGAVRAHPSGVRPRARARRRAGRRVLDASVAALVPSGRRDAAPAGRGRRRRAHGCRSRLRPRASSDPPSRAAPGRRSGGRPAASRPSGRALELAQRRDVEAGILPGRGRGGAHHDPAAPGTGRLAGRRGPRGAA